MSNPVDPEAREFGRWQVDGNPVAIEYSLHVLEELRLEAEDGFQKIPHGGIEIGALLLGEYTENLVRILEWRPIECEHARGPGFVLSANDVAGLQLLLDVCAESKELKGLIPVGWFHTHTRSKIFLSPEDLAVFDKLFPEPWQTALVMRLAKEKPVAAGFFLRETDGSVKSEASQLEFTVEPDPTMMLRHRRKTAAPSKSKGAPPVERSSRPHDIASRYKRENRPSAMQEMAPAEPIAQTVEPVLSRPEPPVIDRQVPSYQPVESPVPERLREIPRGNFRWRAFAAMAVIATFLALALATRPYWSTSAETVALRVEETPDHLWIRWDQGAARIVEADRGTIRILDGQFDREIALDGNAIKRGTLSYQRQGEDVEVRLTLYREGRPTMQELTRYLGGPVAARTEKSDSVEKDQLLEEITQVEAAIAKEAGRAQVLEAARRDLDRKAKAITGRK